MGSGTLKGAALFLLRIYLEYSFYVLSQLIVHSDENKTIDHNP